MVQTSVSCLVSKVKIAKEFAKYNIFFCSIWMCFYPRFIAVKWYFEFGDHIGAIIFGIIGSIEGRTHTLLCLIESRGNKAKDSDSKLCS